MDTNKAKPHDATDNQDIGIRELGRRIHEIAVVRGYWDYVDPNYPDDGPMISPMMVDNGEKLAGIAEDLTDLSNLQFPQNEENIILNCLFHLIDFCVAHNIQLSKLYDNPPTSPS